MPENYSEISNAEAQAAIDAGLDAWLRSLGPMVVLELHDAIRASLYSQLQATGEFLTGPQFQYLLIQGISPWVSLDPEHTDFGDRIRISPTTAFLIYSTAINKVRYLPGQIQFTFEATIPENLLDQDSIILEYNIGQIITSAIPELQTVLEVLNSWESEAVAIKLELLEEILSRIPDDIYGVPVDTKQKFADFITHVKENEAALSTLTSAYGNLIIEDEQESGRYVINMGGLMAALGVTAPGTSQVVTLDPRITRTLEELGLVGVENAEYTWEHEDDIANDIFRVVITHTAEYQALKWTDENLVPKADEAAALFTDFLFDAWEFIGDKANISPSIVVAPRMVAGAVLTATMPYADHIVDYTSRFREALDKKPLDTMAGLLYGMSVQSFIYPAIDGLNFLYNWGEYMGAQARGEVPDNDYSWGSWRENLNIGSPEFQIGASMGETGMTAAEMITSVFFPTPTGGGATVLSMPGKAQVVGISGGAAVMGGSRTVLVVQDVVAVRAGVGLAGFSNIWSAMSKADDEWSKDSSSLSKPPEPPQEVIDMITDNPELWDSNNPLRGFDAEPPGPGWQWRGNPNDPTQGNWVNTSQARIPNGRISIRPALDEPGHLPHWDYSEAPYTKGYRIYQDGTVEVKQ